eukprot:scaffold380758_cov39-Prasinocladus_malaysianus.AAC.1
MVRTRWPCKTDSIGCPAKPAVNRSKRSPSCLAKLRGRPAASCRFATSNTHTTRTTKETLQHEMEQLVLTCRLPAHP